jgi:putative hydrolase of the HAD superfamily
MKQTTLFLDVGGVILTNGWDHNLRKQAALVFGIEYQEMNSRHALTFDTFEIGKISLDEYLERVVFYEQRNFSLEQFKDFMFAHSKAYPEMIEWICQIKRQYQLKIVVVSNEGRELMVNRIQRFQLKEFVDCFICSAFVQLRKPDQEIYRIALEIAQANPEEVIYIDDRTMLAEIGKKMGMQAICHSSLEQTRKELNNIIRT